MIIKAFNQAIFKSANTYRFASAAAAAVDYYSLLGVDRGATRRQIQQAFSKLTRNVNPDNNSALFTRLTEALVILSDGKARDAYDSLLKVRKFSYINQQPESRPAVNSYIADRKAEKNNEFAKKYNIDKFGRYKGGLPNRTSMKRGKALGEIGIMHSLGKEIDVHPYPEYPKVNQQVAESFKNYHQDERQVRTTKKPWMSFEVDYKFFTIRHLLDKLKFAKSIIFLFFIVPTLAIYFLSLGKKTIVVGTLYQQLDKEYKKVKKLQAKKKEEQRKQQEAKKKEEQQKQQQAKKAESENKSA